MHTESVRILVPSIDERLSGQGRATEIAACREVARIECIDPVRDATWLALLQSSSAGLFHSPAWLRVLEDTYSFRIQAYVARAGDGSVLGGVPFCELDDMMGKRIVALPFSDACDPLVDSTATWLALRERLEAHGVPLQLRCLRATTVRSTKSFEVTKRARWHHIKLVSSEDEMWNRLAGSTRRAIRKARRAGVTIRALDQREGCEGFHKLHVALRKRKYRLLAQSPSFFEAIANRFLAQNAWFPRGAFIGDRLVAATIYLKCGDTLYYKFNASAQDALAVRPNNLLLWDGILLAQSLGCSTLDLGPSDDNQPGLIRFKQNFGAEQDELQFLHWVPRGWVDHTAPARQALGELGFAFTAPDVPDEIAARAGDSLYRFFS